MTISQAHSDRLVEQGRNEMMTAFCVVARPNEAQQRDASERFTAFMLDLIPQIVGVVAVGTRYPAFAVTLDDVSGKSGKIVLKAGDLAVVGPALVARKGASLTLVDTDIGRFDAVRTEAEIQPDQRPLPLDASPADDEFADEMGEIAEGEQPEGPLFTVVEAKPLRLHGSDKIVRSWTVIQGDVQIFGAVGAENIVCGLADKLNETATVIGRDLSPEEVRLSIRESLKTLWDAKVIDFDLMFCAPYAAEGKQVSGVETLVKRGPKTAAEKAQAANDGWDAAAAGKVQEDCPHARGALRDRWIYGWSQQRDGRPRPFVIAEPKTPRELGREGFKNGHNFHNGHPDGMSFPDIGGWREGWKEAEAESVALGVPVNDTAAEHVEVA